MTAISRKLVNIAIMNSGVNPSAIRSSDFIKGQIKSYSKSGGGSDLESDPHFGGFVDKEKPEEQVELSFDITPSLEDADRWDSIAHSVDGATGVYTLAGSISNRSVFIEAVKADAGSKSHAFNNCNVHVLDFDHNADDNRSGRLTLKFSPTNSNGVSNYMTRATTLTSLPNWTSLDNN